MNSLIECASWRIPTKITMKFKYYKQYRLPEFDYSSDNGYFITVCTKNREHFFGKIENSEMYFTEIGLEIKSKAKISSNVNFIYQYPNISSKVTSFNSPRFSIAFISRFSFLPINATLYRTGFIS